MIVWYIWRWRCLHCLPPFLCVCPLHLSPYLRRLCRWLQRTSASYGGLPKRCRGGRNCRTTLEKMKRRSLWSKSKRWEPFFWYMTGSVHLSFYVFVLVRFENNWSPFVAVPFRKGRGHQRESLWSLKSSRNRWCCNTTGGRRSSRWGKAKTLVDFYIGALIKKHIPVCTKCALLTFPWWHFQKLEEADDDGYLDSDWSDRQALKKQFQGLTNIKWGPR